MNNNIAKICIGAICIAATVILSIASAFAPIFSVIFALLASVFTAYCHIRCGKTASLFNIIITSGIILVLGGMQVELMVIPLMGLVPGLVSGLMQGKRVDYYASLGGVSVAFATVLMTVMYFAALSVEGGIGGIFDMTGEAAKLSINQTISAVGAEDAQMLTEAVDSAIGYMKMMFPSAVIILSMIMGYIHIMATTCFLRRLSKIKLSNVPLDMHLAPRHLSYMYFIATIFILFSLGGGTITAVLNNIVAVFDFILAFCGFSLIESKFKERLRYGFVRGFIYVAVFLVANSLAVQILSIMGMLDSFVNYRGIRRFGE